MKKIFLSLLAPTILVPAIAVSCKDPNQGGGSHVDEDNLSNIKKELKQTIEEYKTMLLSYRTNFLYKNSSLKQIDEKSSNKAILEKFINEFFVNIVSEKILEMSGKTDDLLSDLQKFYNANKTNEFLHKLHEPVEHTVEHAIDAIKQFKANTDNFNNFLNEQTEHKSLVLYKIYKSMFEQNKVLEKSKIAQSLTSDYQTISNAIANTDERIWKVRKMVDLDNDHHLDNGDDNKNNHGHAHSHATANIVLEILNYVYTLQAKYKDSYSQEKANLEKIATDENKGKQFIAKFDKLMNIDLSENSEYYKYVISARSEAIALIEKLKLMAKHEQIDVAATFPPVKLADGSEIK
ncbi:MAG5150 family histidine triad lipoprotein [Mycoplasmopsis opalescens]|uniref:MAG5150 family histidine triad lipoprotein n=1 Tax=Mycoplasmopsis opalescens TaxID=114886 RepID=UPI0004A6C696|nr:hypothetical protein [Mycoplasmopsis opalescens]